MYVRMILSNPFSCFFFVCSNFNFHDNFLHKINIWCLFQPPIFSVFQLTSLGWQGGCLYNFVV
jgi:hypothetical protein